LIPLQNVFNHKSIVSLKWGEYENIQPRPQKQYLYNKKMSAREADDLTCPNTFYKTDDTGSNK